jgi:hypothetical protein
MDPVERLTAAGDGVTEGSEDSYVRGLERENAELRRANERLARDRLGVHDAAAAAVLRAEQRDRLEPVAVAGAKVFRGVMTVVLMILPHGLTLILLRIREELRRGSRR